MRAFFILSFISALSTLAFAQNQSASGDGFHATLMSKAEDYCYGKGASRCLTMIMHNRCEIYSKTDAFGRGLLPCRAAVSALVKELDIYADAEEMKQVIFSNKLIELARDASTLTYLKELTVTVDEATEAGERFNLWSFTSNYYQSGEKALEVLAVIFQATTVENYHPQYLRSLESVKGEFVDALDEAIAAISVERFLSEEGAHIELYPVSIINYAQFLNPSPYHFYVPAYLTSKLRKLKYDEKDAVFAPVLFNALYELSEVDYKYWMLLDPPKIDSNAYAWKLRDIYASYLGTNFGKSRAYYGFSLADVKDLQTFSKEFSDCPKCFLSRLMKNKN